MKSKIAKHETLIVETEATNELKESLVHSESDQHNRAWRSEVTDKDYIKLR